MPSLPAQHDVQLLLPLELLLQPLHLLPQCVHQLLGPLRVKVLLLHLRDTTVCMLLLWLVLLLTGGRGLSRGLCYFARACSLTWLHIHCYRLVCLSELCMCPR